VTRDEAKRLKRAQRVATKAAVREELRKGRREFRCFWTWPWGHVSSGIDAGYHSECVICGKTLTSAD
jgi:hypothetical protein